MCDRLDMIKTLLSHGADPNIVTADGGNFPVLHEFFTKTAGVRRILVKEFAKLSVEEKHICKENLRHLRRNGFKNYFKNCSNELRRMKNCHVFRGLTLYDILMQKKTNKLVLLSEDVDFKRAFKTAIRDESIVFYAENLDEALATAMNKRNVLRLEEEKLNAVF